MDDNKQLFGILETDSWDALMNEVRIILKMVSSDFHTMPVASAFHATVSLYNGTYPGYRPCNTQYHDIHHTLTTFLATARLIHGAVLSGKTFTESQIILTLISSLLHDAGYIQMETDACGTGAKYTNTHVQRSMVFLEQHGAEFGLSSEEIAHGKIIILCTDISADLHTILYPSPEVEFFGKILAVADVMAQMADRLYLEKLLYLYHEFKEGEIEGFENEVDLLKKTAGFYDFIAHRLEFMFDKVHRYLKLHFFRRWQIDENLYLIAIQKHRAYLEKIMEKPDPIRFLKRGGIAESVRKAYGNLTMDA